jgi:hypothetical protein
MSYISLQTLEIKSVKSSYHHHHKTTTSHFVAIASEEASENKRYITFKKA